MRQNETHYANKPKQMRSNTCFVQASNIAKLKTRQFCLCGKPAADGRCAECSKKMKAEVAARCSGGTAVDDE